jgi:RNA polymerase subunit RPABC4/transcription elongation factor Spt4
MVWLFSVSRARAAVPQEVFFLSRSDTALEVLALRQQVAMRKRKRPRPMLNRLDRLFWTALRHFWSRWRDVLVIVKPETVISWHRAGFRLYWRWRSRRRGLERAKDAIQRTSLRLSVALDCAAKLYAKIDARTDCFVAAWNATHPTHIIQRCRGARTASACLRYTTNATAVCDACGSRK